MPKAVFRRTALLLAAAAMLAGPAAAPAQNKSPQPNWPVKPVRILVGFPGGSTPDLVARAIAEPLSQALGQPVIVENKPGAGGNIAADAVAKATDQHTIGVLINGNMTIAKILNPKVPYDPLKDLAPISLIGTAPLVLTAPANSPGRTAAQWFEAARNSGNKLSYGSPGVGTVGHLGMELLKTRAAIDPVHVPYPGNPQVIAAMIGGQIDLALLPPGLAGPQIAAGKLRALGVTSAGRSALAPDVPSLADAGIKDYQLEIWTAAAAPASMPKPIVSALSALISDIARSPDMRQKLLAQGWTVAGTSAEGLALRIKTDTRVLGGVIALRGISTN